jgi:hypothetical protein
MKSNLLRKPAVLPVLAAPCEMRHTALTLSDGRVSSNAYRNPGTECVDNYLK